MESDFLKQYYLLERTHWWFTVREKIIRQQIRKSLSSRKNLRILNAGAATGRTTELLQEFGEVISVEVDHNTCEFLRNELHMAVTEATVTALPFEDHSFDIVCAFDVLEHIEDDVLAVAELKRVSKPGAMLFATTPAFNFLWSSHDEVNQHYRRYNGRTLSALLNHGFELEYVGYFNTLLFLPIAAYRVVNRLFTSTKKPHSDFDGNALTGNRWIAAICRQLFSVEVFLLRYMKLPFGISLLACGKNV